MWITSIGGRRQLIVTLGSPVSSNAKGAGMGGKVNWIRAAIELATLPSQPVSSGVRRFQAGRTAS